MLTPYQIKKWTRICEIGILIVATIMMFSSSFRSDLFSTPGLIGKGIVLIVVLLIFMLVFEYVYPVCPVAILKRFCKWSTLFLLCNYFLMLVMFFYYSLNKGFAAFYQNERFERNIEILLMLILLIIPAILDSIGYFQVQDNNVQTQKHESSFTDCSKK